MGKLYDLKIQIESVIKAKKLDEFQTKGQIGLKSGLLFGMIKSDTPDDQTKYAKLKEVAELILNSKLS